jgi:hypothetical protein
MKALHQKVGKRTLKDNQVSYRLCGHHLKGPPTSSPKTWIEQSTADGVMLQMFVGSALIRGCPRIELSDRVDDDSKTVFKARREAPCGTRPPGGSIVATNFDMKPI